MNGDDLPVQDDPTISDEAFVLRRIPKDKVKGDNVPASDNFKPRNGEGWSCTIFDSCRDIENILFGHPEFGVVKIGVSDLRNEGLIIVRRPLPYNNNHCEAYGDFKKKACRRLANSAEWVVNV